LVETATGLETERTTTIGSGHGLSARPAGIVALLSHRQGSGHVPRCRRGRSPSEPPPPHPTLPRENPITPHPIRAAFTLTELLAVIAVCAVMFALPRPAARAANEATPETQGTDDLDPITKERHDHRATAAGQPFPEGRDPRPLLKEIIARYRDKDVSGILEARTTKVGRRVLGWLVEQKWFDERPDLVITEKKSQGDRHELVDVYKFADGTEKVALVFFWEGGTLKFHDVCCLDLKGIRANMFLSYILENPNAAATWFAIQNPTVTSGKSFELLRSWLW
jgi:hypothetical protein